MKVVNINGEMAKDKKVVSSLLRAMKTGNTIIFVHAEWCPYTVAFYPIWNAFENSHKETKDIKVFKIDHVAIGTIRASHPKIYDSIGDLDISSETYKIYFPTVVMYADGARKKYSPSVRTLKNLTSFVSKVTSVKSPKTMPGVKASTSSKTNNTVTQRGLKYKNTQIQNSLQGEINAAFHRLFKQ